jgi:hypothetical protein
MECVKVRVRILAGAITISARDGFGNGQLHNPFAVAPAAERIVEQVFVRADVAFALAFRAAALDSGRGCWRFV